MILKKTAILMAAACLLVGVAACKRLPPPPDGLPQLYPCTVSVTFGGEPVADVKIALKPVDDASKWRAGGRTDAKGRAVIQTSFAYDGAPAGQYIISFSKVEETIGNTMAEMQGRSLIPLKYGPDRSRETAEITEGKNELQFALDAGEEQIKAPKGARMPKL